MNLLASGEAVDLLLRTGEVDETDAAALAAAAEIVELCGNLPLYLTICGGVLLGYDGDPAWKTELPAMLKDDRIGVIEEGAGDRTVQCLVDSSLSMLKDEAAAGVFMALGVCPEDVQVKLAVVQLIADAAAASNGGGAGGDAAVSGAAKATAMRRIVKALVNRNLLQGDIANGVQQHDIVRDLVRSRLGGEDGIRMKQRAVVAAFMSACLADGWSGGEAVGQYAVVALQLHMVEALLPDPVADFHAHTWLEHPNELISRSAATAMGGKVLELVSADREADGDLVGAARVAWAAYSVTQQGSAQTELLYRVAALLETASAGSTVGSKFERDVLSVLVILLSEYGSERHTKAIARNDALLAAAASGTTVTLDMLRAEYFAKVPAAMALWGNYLGDPLPFRWEGVCSGTSSWRQASMELSSRCQKPDVPSERHAGHLNCAMIMVFTTVTCHMPDWDALTAGEAELVEALEFFQAHPEWSSTPRRRMTPLRSMASNSAAAAATNSLTCRPALG